MKIIQSNTILYCCRWSETVAFYRDIIGLNQSQDMDWFVVFEVTSHATLSIADEHRSTIKSAGGRGVTVTFQVPDVDKIRAELEVRGARPEPIRTIWGSRSFFINDPEGNRLEIWS